MPFFPPRIWDAENKIVLGNVSRLFGFSLFVLDHFSLLGVGLGLSIKWAGVVKFFGPIEAMSLTKLKLWDLSNIWYKLCLVM